MAEEVRIPDIGDVDHVEVIEIFVAVGDAVGPDDPLIVIESDKASMDVPAGKAGRIASVDVAVGDEVTEGSLIVTLETDSAEAPEDEEKPDSAAGETGASAAAEATAEEVEEAVEEIEDTAEDAAEETEEAFE